jgi:hypothetical protein
MPQFGVRKFRDGERILRTVRILRGDSNRLPDVVECSERSASGQP